MSQNTNIEWTDATWNPTEGCTMAKGSELGGCLNCYAARTALRHPASGLAVMRDSGPRWTGKVGLVESRLDAPLHWRSPKKIFVNSMSDLFHEALPVRDIDKVFAVMSQSPQHTFQILTKRPETMQAYVTAEWTPDGIDEAAGAFGWCHANVQGRWPLPNVWLGVSVENQVTADARIPLLLQTPAAIRFCSYEPALGPVDFRRFLRHQGKKIERFEDIPSIFDVRILNWLIAGGESGPGARPAHPNWFRSARDQCLAAHVSFFFKQHGAWVSVSEVAGKGKHFHFPDGATVRRVGKKAAGASLDGREWKQFPEIQ